MRYVGSYDLAVTPSFADLAAASTVARQAALTALVPIVDAAAAIHAAAVPDVHALAEPPLTDAQKATLIDGYDGRSAAVKRMLEDMRESLDPHHLELCPFCNLDTRAELDHFLPKTQHHEFALYGPNLIPICPVCNKSKGTVIANEAGERVVLMPTADTAALQRLLVAKLTIVAPVPRVAFSIDPLAVAVPDQLDLVRRHFKRLGLARRYRGRATSLLPVLKRSVALGGGTRTKARTVINCGHANAQDEEPINSWRRAFYDAIIGQAEAFEDWLVS